MLETVLIIVLILLLIGAFPAWPYNRSWSPGWYGPGSLIWVILLIILIIFLLGHRTTL